MSRATVLDLLERIGELPDEDRRLLDDLLAEQEDREWEREAVKARERARHEGVDQEAIDRAVREVRRAG